MTDITLPSGAKFKVQPAPFAHSKALYQAVLAEARWVQLEDKNSVANAVKDAVSLVGASPVVDAALTPCLTRCTLNGLRIDQDTFEPAERREDYIPAITEVIKANIAPFLKGLFAAYTAGVSLIASKLPESK